MSGWMKAIIGAVLLGALCEMLMPDDNYKKYVKLVSGLLIVIVLLQPIIKLKDENFDVNLYTGSNYSMEDIQQKAYDRQQKQVENTFKIRLENEIEKVIKDECRVQVEISTENGEINLHRVTAEMENKNHNAEQIRNTIKTVTGLGDDSIIVTFRIDERNDP